MTLIQFIQFYWYLWLSALILGLIIGIIVYWRTPAPSGGSTAPNNKFWWGGLTTIGVFVVVSLALAFIVVVFGGPAQGGGETVPTPTEAAYAFTPTPIPQPTSTPVPPSATLTPQPPPAATQTPVPPTATLTATPEVGPNCPATTDGSTNCSCMEDWLDRLLLLYYGISDPGLLGTMKYPLRYPATWLHDLCYAKSGGGTGAKYIEIAGPAALQMGEANGPFGMTFVQKNTMFKGWTQGGWRYVSDQAVLAQWMPEAQGTWEQLAADKNLGLICGYQWNNREFAQAFRWDGSKPFRDKSLDCPLPWPLTKPAKKPATGVIMDYQIYPSIFKLETTEGYLCGARNKSVIAWPAGVTRVVEDYPKGPEAGNYLHDPETYGLSYKGYCKGHPVDAAGNPVTQTVWRTVLLETDGFHEVTFPLQ